MPFFNAEVTYEQGVGLIARGIPINSFVGGSGSGASEIDGGDAFSSTSDVIDGGSA